MDDIIKTKVVPPEVYQLYTYDGEKLYTTRAACDSLNVIVARLEYYCRHKHANPYIVQGKRYWRHGDVERMRALEVAYAEQKLSRRKQKLRLFTPTNQES